MHPSDATRSRPSAAGTAAWHRQAGSPLRPASSGHFSPKSPSQASTPLTRDGGPPTAGQARETKLGHRLTRASSHGVPPRASHCRAAEFAPGPSIETRQGLPSSFLLSLLLPPGLHLALARRPAGPSPSRQQPAGPRWAPPAAPLQPSAHTQTPLCTGSRPSVRLAAESGRHPGPRVGQGPVGAGNQVGWTRGSYPGCPGSPSDGEPRQPPADRKCAGSSSSSAPDESCG